VLKFGRYRADASRVIKGNRKGVSFPLETGVGPVDETPPQAEL